MKATRRDSKSLYNTILRNYYRTAIKEQRLRVYGQPFSRTSFTRNSLKAEFLVLSPSLSNKIRTIKSEFLIFNRHCCDLIVRVILSINN